MDDKSHHLETVDGLIGTINTTARAAYELAADAPGSECLHEAWRNLDAAHTLLCRYIRLQRETDLT